MSAPEDLAQSAIYRHPSDNALGRLLPRLLHAPRWTRLRRALSRRWPMPVLASDVPAPAGDGRGAARGAGLPAAKGTVPGRVRAPVVRFWASVFQHHRWP
ncbi:hypothetical protein GUV60_16980 [Stenotrophomonas maltophilia]|nr:hypothetical protein [Stenotrophomonas maltophilia]